MGGICDPHQVEFLGHGTSRTQRTVAPQTLGRFVIQSFPQNLRRTTSLSGDEESSNCLVDRHQSTQKMHLVVPCLFLFTLACSRDQSDYLYITVAVLNLSLTIFRVGAAPLLPSKRGFYC